MTLACLGPVVFDLRNDLQAIESETNSSFAKHDVMGAAPVYEATGDDESTVTLTGVLHPYVFGATGHLARLEAARAGKIPLPLLRGDFVPVGWFLIKSITRKDAELDAFDGIGHEIEYSVDLIKVDTPGFGSAGAILGLFQ